MVISIIPVSRSKMLDDLNSWSVTKKEQEWAVENHKSFKSLLALLSDGSTKKEGGATFNSNVLVLKT